MIIKHPNTQNKLVMNEQTSIMAEIEVNCQGFALVRFGYIGYHGSVDIGSDEWPGFKDLVQQIDQAIQEMK